MTSVPIAGARRGPAPASCSRCPCPGACTSSPAARARAGAAGGPGGGDGRAVERRARRPRRAHAGGRDAGREPLAARRGPCPRGPVRGVRTRRRRPGCEATDGAPETAQVADRAADRHVAAHAARRDGPAGRPAGAAHPGAPAVGAARASTSLWGWARDGPGRADAARRRRRTTGSPVVAPDATGLVVTPTDAMVAQYADVLANGRRVAVRGDVRAGRVPDGHRGRPGRDGGRGRGRSGTVDGDVHAGPGAEVSLATVDGGAHRRRRADHRVHRDVRRSPVGRSPSGSVLRRR